MYLATVTAHYGTKYFLARHGWTAERNHWEVLTFRTKQDAYHAYLRAPEAPSDEFQAEYAEQLADVTAR